jgi:colanic acid biosynthesis glycosyl transferase WcaI
VGKHNDSIDIAPEQREAAEDVNVREFAQQPRKLLDVLIYGMNYTPEMVGVGRYTGDIGQYLSSNGHTVRVVTAPPHYPEWSVKAGYNAFSYTSEIDNGISIVRCPIFLKTRMRDIWRLIAPLSFALSSAPIVLWLILRHRPDVVMCVEPTLLTAPAALIAAKCAGARTMLHVQDLEIDAAFAVGHVKGRRLQRVAYFCERRVLRGFEQVIAISIKLSERLVANGVDPERITVIRNWVDLDRIRPLSGPNPFRSELGFSEETFIVLCSGSIGAKQALHVVLDVAERFADENSSVVFVVAGEGPQKRHLIERYGYLPNVRFLPLQAEDRLCEFLNLADLHVLSQDRGVADFVFPSKLGGMLASGKRLLVAADPETELFKILEGTAIIIPPGDRDAMAEAISRIASQKSHSAVGNGNLTELFSKRNCLKQFEFAVVGE